MVRAGKNAPRDAPRDAPPSRSPSPSPSDVQSPSSYPSYGIDDALESRRSPGTSSLRSSRMNSRNSLLTTPRTASLFGIRNAYFQVDDMGVYVSTVAITVLISVVAIITAILLTLVISLALALGKYQKKPGVNSCASFNLNSEINNLQGFLLPSECSSFIAQYVESGQYYVDFAVAVEAARQYLHTLEVHRDGRDLVVLDIDETSLSNMPYYAHHHYGTVHHCKTLQKAGIEFVLLKNSEAVAFELLGSVLVQHSTPYFAHRHYRVEAWNERSWSEWVNSAIAPALDPMLSLYTDLRAQNWSVAFITGRSESMGPKTALNLHKAGYRDWTTLILRAPNEQKLTAVEYKSKYRRMLANEGYRIRSSLGDQWSDLIGGNTGERTFKMPNPMYYIH